MTDTALQNAIDAVGSAAELARRLKIRPAAISQWTRAPVTRVLEIERITGVSRHDLRPDIYGPEPSSKKQAMA